MRRTILLAAAGILAGAFMYGCDSSVGNQKIDLTAPPVPSDMVLSKVGNGAVTLTWTAVSDGGLKGYTVYWKSGTTVDSATANRLFVTTNTATITGLEYETTYSFAVSSTDASGNESRLSAIRSGTPFNTEPPLPPDGVDVVAENIESSKITLYWNANTEPDIARYEVYRSPSATGFTDNLLPIATVTDEESYIDTTAEVGVVYYYRVKAVDRGDRKSDASGTVSDVVLTRPSIIAPLNFAYVSSTPVFSWQAVVGAERYSVVVTTSSISGEIWSTEVDGTVNQVAYAGRTKLVSGTKYYWKVGAISREEVNSVSSGSFTIK